MDLKDVFAVACMDWADCLIVRGDLSPFYEFTRHVQPEASGDEDDDDARETERPKLTPLAPRDYLDFAYADLQQEDLRGLVNAIGNAKRAIDSQVERMVACLGYSPKDRGKAPKTIVRFLGVSEKIPWDVPIMLDLLAALRITPALVIRQLRGLRNRVEHHYDRPSSVHSQNAVELADLFLSAVDKALGSLVGNWLIGDNLTMFDGEGEHSEYLDLALRKRDSSQPLRFEATLYNQREKAVEVVVTPNDDHYLELMRVALAISLELRPEPPIVDLLRKLELEVPEGGVHVDVEFI